MPDDSDGSTAVPSASDVQTAPSIPGQRGPTSPLVEPPPPWLGEEPAPAKSGRKRALLLTAALAVVVLVIGTIVAIGYGAGDKGRVLPAAAATAAPSAKAVALTPFESASTALDEQAKALMRGDEAAWLAIVDPAQPKLRTRYRTMYRSLRALGVSHFEYHTSIRPAKKGATVVGAEAAYCFSLTVCPTYAVSDEWAGPPRITQKLTFRPLRGQYVISKLDKDVEPNHQQPTPWENSELVFAQGKRVTVAASRSQAKHLAKVVALADKAAAIDDRFAGLVGNAQRRYRVYLADDKAWKTWYGGETDKWIVGYAIPLNIGGSDVVLKMSELVDDRRLMVTTLQHELGHVVTLSGVYRSRSAADLWLTEGIAEYIGWYPKHATASWRRPSVRAAVNGRHRPKSIVAKPLGKNAGADAGDAFYGLAHFAADCMAQKYGEAKLFQFVQWHVREGFDYDDSSKKAFGKPFATVDKACVAWIRDKA